MDFTVDGLNCYIGLKVDGLNGCIKWIDAHLLYLFYPSKNNL
jgi:hypothetical protein